MARWKLLETAFIADRLVAEGDEITTTDTIIPGPHMEPLDDAAKALAEKHADRMQPVGNVLDQLTAALDEARAQAQVAATLQAQAMAAQLGPALAQSIAQAMAEATAKAKA